MNESRENIEEINFYKYWLILQRHQVAGFSVFGMVITLTSLFAFSLKPTYKTEANLLIKTNRTSSLTGLGESLGKIEPLTFQANPLDTQAQIVLSRPAIEKTIADLQLKDKKGKLLPVQALTDNLNATGAKGTDVLQISYTDKDPVQAAKIVNKLIEIYIQQNMQANRGEAASARKFILAQLPKTEAFVRQAELNLRKFKEENQIISLQEEEIAGVKAIASLEDQISQSQAQLASVTAKLQKLQNQASIDSQQTVASASLSQKPGIQQLLTQIQSARTELKIALIRFQDAHPTVVNLKEKVATLNSLLREQTKQVIGNNQLITAKNSQIGELRQLLLSEFARTETEHIALEKKISKLSQNLVAYKQRAKQLPKLEETQRQLERKLQASQVTYESLLKKLQEVQLAENQNIGNVRVISPAFIPKKPAASRKKLIVGSGVIFGIMLGIIAALALDLIDQSLKTVKEAKELFQYTLLGIIPSISEHHQRGFLGKVEQQEQIPKLIGTDIPQFPVGDAYQILQANLNFLSDKQLNSIVVTSSVPKEGKSFVAANLAVAMAQMGRKVLLVDANMRHPTQHHIWGLSLKNVLGLSNVITNQVTIDIPIEQVMQNLFVLPSGTLPPNPLSLLNSQRMAELVQGFVQDYDLVIFDTNSILGTADATTLGRLTDGILLVVRPGVVDWNSAKSTKDLLSQSSQNVLGMVVNDVSRKREPNSYLYHSHESIESGDLLQNSSLKKQASLI
ncbi:MAG: polysaccharide biosynthesis tyrosine autokinase [Calothrix sp. MO_167.B12]|nr:polysaccharide biosynthesis tyrosine autokinase [Calothrix sp. MO_167.B12]